MAIKKVILARGEVPKSYHLQKIQDNVEDEFKTFSNAPFLSGVLVTQALVTGDNTINHGLGRKYQGWVIAGKNANEDIWESATENQFKNKQIILEATAAVTAQIYIF